MSGSALISLSEYWNSDFSCRRYSSTFFSAELPGPRPRLHMHENTTTKPTEKTYAEQLPRGSLADPSLLADRACPICLEGFVAGDELVVLPCQGLHVSHSACLQPWLVKAHTCPTCRFELP